MLSLSKTFSIRLPGTLKDKETVKAGKARNMSRSKYIAVATGEKLVRDNVITEQQFKKLFGFDPEM